MMTEVKVSAHLIFFLGLQCFVIPAASTNEWFRTCVKARGTEVQMATRRRKEVFCFSWWTVSLTSTLHCRRTMTS